MPTKTLRSYQQKPLIRQFDMKSMPVQKVAAITEDRYNNPSTVSPDEAAHRYYFNAHWFNHLMAERHIDEPLEAWEPVVDRFFLEGTGLADRMFHYLLLICTRESRHAHFIASKQETMKNKFSEASLTFHEKYAHTNKPQACQSLFEIEQHWPGVTMGEYTEWLVWVFNRGKYGGGFGGKAWAAVAEVLRRVVHGEITYEMMIDQAFNSAHNNGPIFNKGMLFTGYTSNFINLLDVQRSGQIPNLYAEKSLYGKDWYNCVADIMFEWDEFEDLFHSELDVPYVDWFKVEDLGSVHKYPSQKKYQLKTYGGDTEFVEAASTSHLKVPVQWQVTENCQVSVLKRNPDGTFTPYTVGDQINDKKAA